MAAPKKPYFPGLERGRQLWRERTHCKRGHEYTPENVYINPSSGARQCVACLKIIRPRCKKMGREYMNNAQTAWRKRNPEKVRENDRIQNLKGFGLTVSDYDQMLVAQGGVCAICKKQCSSGRRLHVDHDHKTGVVRGLLCGRCNPALGAFDDSPALLAAAITYLTDRDNKEGAS